MSMKFTVTTEPPIDIEISANGETHHISFYPTDLAVRERFYQTYENLKNYKPNDIKVKVDENGVSNAELENAKELRRYAEFLGEQIGGIYAREQRRYSPAGAVSRQSLSGLFARPQNTLHRPPTSSSGTTPKRFRAVS